MALALNNPQKVDMPLNKETKANLKEFCPSSFFWLGIKLMVDNFQTEQMFLVFSYVMELFPRYQLV